jgi:hypothetical protein
LLGEELQHLALERSIVEREARKIGQIDRIARQPILSLAQPAREAIMCQFSGQRRAPHLGEGDSCWLPAHEFAKGCMTPARVDPAFQ